MQAHRKGTRKKIAARLAQHWKLMKEFMDKGHSRDEASALAFAIVMQKKDKKA